jgi:protein phosphatase
MSQAARIFDSGATTDVGKVRDENEDAYLVFPEVGLWAVADGMGGHEAGALASATVVNALQTINTPSSVTDLINLCQDRLSHANRELLQIADARGGIVIGATVAAFLAHNGYYAALWSGDSRVYQLRGDAIAQISRDHTEVAELIAEGVLTPEEARNWPRRNVITRAIGVHDEIDVEVTQGILQKGDTFIICSDGLTAHVSDEEIFEKARSLPPQTASDALVAMTMERGAVDNVTVVIIRYAARGSTVVFPASAGPIAKWDQT